MMLGVLSALLLACQVAEPVAEPAPAPVLATAPAGDPARGEQIYARCIGCHSLDWDRTGPRHCGLLGRRAGTVPGFAYSPAMSGSGITWDAANLDRFLANPTEVVPGTRMTFAGVPDAAERRDLVAWLIVASTDPALCPAAL